MNKRINSIIPDAIAAIKSHMAKDDKRTIAKEYKGDISALGAGIVRSGLLPTLSFFSQQASSARDKEDTKNRRLKLMKAIKSLFLKHSHFHQEIQAMEDDAFLFLIIRLLNTKDNVSLTNARANFEFSMNEQKEQVVKRELNEIAVALKMAMRVFENK